MAWNANTARSRVIGGAVAGILAVGVAGGAVYAAGENGTGAARYFAQVTPTTASPSTLVSNQPATHPKHATLKTVLDQLVAQGTINSTQEQAILTRVRAELPHHPGFGGPRPFVGAELHAVASVLKLQPGVLRSDLRAGQSLHQIAAAQGVSDQTVDGTILQAAKTRLDKAVAAKRITTTQEQTMLNRLQARLPKILSATPGKGFPGRPNGNWHRNGNRPGNSATPQATASPATQ